MGSCAQPGRRQEHRQMARRWTHRGADVHGMSMWQFAQMNGIPKQRNSGFPCESQVSDHHPAHRQRITRLDSEVRAINGQTLNQKAMTSAMMPTHRHSLHEQLLEISDLQIEFTIITTTSFLFTFTQSVHAARQCHSWKVH